MDFFEGLFKKVKNSKKTDEPEENHMSSVRSAMPISHCRKDIGTIYRTGSAKVAVKCLSIRRSRVI